MKLHHLLPLSLVTFVTANVIFPAINELFVGIPDKSINVNDEISDYNSGLNSTCIDNECIRK